MSSRRRPRSAVLWETSTWCTAEDPGTGAMLGRTTGRAPRWDAGDCRRGSGHRRALRPRRGTDLLLRTRRHHRLGQARDGAERATAEDCPGGCGRPEPTRVPCGCGPEGPAQTLLRRSVGNRAWPTSHVSVGEVHDRMSSSWRLDGWHGSGLDGWWSHPAGFSGCAWGSSATRATIAAVARCSALPQRFTWDGLRSGELCQYRHPVQRRSGSHSARGSGTAEKGRTSGQVEAAGAASHGASGMLSWPCSPPRST